MGTEAVAPDRPARGTGADACARAGDVARRAALPVAACLLWLAASGAAAADPFTGPSPPGATSYTTPQHGQDPSAVAERQRSRTAYEDMGRDDAVALAERTFGIDQRLWQPPAAQMGATFERFAGDYGEVVEAQGHRLLATSTTPLRVADGSGQKLPVSLSLVDRDGTLVPEQPLVPVAFADDGSGQMSLPGGIAVTPIRAGAGAPGLAGNRLVYANSGLDSDFMAEPVPAGDHVFWQLRSERSPDPGLRFALPPGARLEAGDDGIGGARVVRDGETLLEVSPAVSVDADGVNVPTSTSVTGNVLSVHVDLGGDVHFPVEVDPTIAISSGTNASANEFYGWTTADSPSGWFQFNAYYNLLHVSADPAQHPFSTWNWGAWYIPQHGDAQPTRVDLQGMEHGPASQSAWAGGMYSGSLNNWTGTWTTNGYAGNMGSNQNYGNTAAFSGLGTAYCARSGGGNDYSGNLCDYVTGASGFEFTVFLAGALTVTNYSRIGGASITYIDNNLPSASLGGIPSGWVESLPNVSLSGSDGGVGVQTFTVNLNGQTQSQGESCGSPYSFCPGSDTKYFNFASPPEGVYSASATVYDEVSNPRSTSATVHVDHSDPMVAASGTLWNDRGLEVVDGDFPVTVTGSDAYSGVHDVHLYLDGTDVGLPTNSCDANSGCPTPSGQPWSFHSASYAAGPHTFRMGATDAVGRAIPQASQPSWTVTIDRAPANTAAPALSGTPFLGNSMSVTPGSWTGWPAPTYTYQWVRNGSPISGATSSTYTLTSADVGRSVSAIVTARNTVGSSSATSAASATVDGPPVNDSAPSIGGTARDGQVLTGSDGAWRSSPAATVTRQWRRCDAGGANCQDIAGATGTTYTAGPADVGLTLRYQVNELNSYGSVTVPSSPSAVVAGQPVDDTAPSASGTPQDGQTLTGNDGAWRSSPAAAVSRRWRRCDAGGANCQDTGGTGTTYTAGPADVAYTLRYQVTESNTYGTVTVASSPTAVVAGRPANDTAPSVSGTPQDGQTLTGNDGTWRSSPAATVSRQWRRCDASGVNCGTITGATSPTYTPGPADVGRTLRYQVTEANSYGSTTVPSSPTVVVAGKPVNDLLPSTSGTAQDGQTLTGNDGTWRSSPAATVSRQWQRCDAGGANCQDVAGATNATYQLTHGDVGSTLRYLVTESNGYGSAAAESPATLQIAAAPPASVVAPTITGTGRDGQTVTAHTQDADWAGTPPFTYAYQWQRCASSTGSCSDVAGATGPTYTFGHADAFTYMRVSVTAANSVGSGAGYSAIGYVDGLPPKNLVVPVITGKPKVGETLTVTTHAADWDGSPVSTYHYLWQRCIDAIASCWTVGDSSSAATTNTYTVQQSDLGYRIVVLVQARNPAGYGQVDTVPTATVLGAGTPADATLATLPGSSASDPGSSSLAALSGPAEPTTPLEQPTQPTPQWVGATAGHTAAQGYFGGGFSSPSIAYGDGSLFVGSGRTLSVYPATDPSQGLTTSVNLLASDALGAITGVAYYRGEAYVSLDRKDNASGTSAVVALSRTGGVVTQRTIATGSGPADAVVGVAHPQGLDVAWGQVYVLDRETATNAQGQDVPVDLVKVFDAQTGALTGIASSPVDNEPTSRGDAGTDVSAGPEADLVVVGRRALWHVQAVGPLLASWPSTDLNALDVGQQLDRDATVDWCACPKQRGTDWVWGMNWLLSVDEAGARIDEYGSGTLRRSWAPRQTDGSVSDVVYRKRSTSLDWGGQLTTSSHWLAGVQPLDYTVTNGDIYPVGARGEHWYELAPNLDHVELAIDGTQVTSFTPDSTPVTQPNGTLRFDTAGFPNGTHTLTLTAVLVGGQRVTLSRSGLRLDNVGPAGELDTPPTYLRQTRTLSGQMSDPDSGPRDWQLQLRRVSDENGGAIVPGPWQSPCPAGDATAPYTCDWQTGGDAYPDGRYELRGHKRDNVLETDGGPNQSDSQTATTTVDNTPPRSTIAGAPSGWTRADPVTLAVTATDNLSGITDIALDDNTTSLPDYSNGGPNSTTVSGEGTHQISARATDGAGNVEANPATATVRIDHTPPATTQSGLPACGGWSTSDVHVGLASTDQPNLSGVAKLTETEDGGTAQDHASGFDSAAFTGEGQHTLSYQATDNAGNVEVLHQCGFGIDTVPPVTAITGVPAGWTNLSATATLTPSDATSGVEHLHVDSDGTATDYPGNAQRTVTYASEGVHTLKAHAYDVAGNVEAEQTRTVRVDKTPPATTESGLPACDGWATHDVTVSLSSSDQPGLSGIQKLTDTKDGAAPNDVPSGVDGIGFGSDGQHSLTYQATDNASNVEALHTCRFGIDKVPPATDIAGVPAGWTNQNVTVTLTPSDATSGVDHLHVDSDGAATDYPGAAQRSITYTSEGVHTLKVRAYDVAGNVETEQTKTISIDRTPPTSGASGVPSGWSAQPVTVTISGDDGTGHSGVAAIHYTINGWSEQVTSGASAQIPFTDGQYALHYWAVDNAGNVGDAHDATIKVDTAPPALNVTGDLRDRADGQEIWYDDPPPQLSASADDSGAGVTSIEIQIDGSRTDFAQQSCGGGGCSLNRGYTFPSSSEMGGQHTISVIATDAAGHTASDAWTVNYTSQASAMTEAPYGPPTDETDADFEASDQKADPGPASTDASFGSGDIPDSCQPDPDTPDGCGASAVSNTQAEALREPSLNSGLSFPLAVDGLSTPATAQSLRAGGSGWGIADNHAKIFKFEDQKTVALAQDVLGLGVRRLRISVPFDVVPRASSPQTYACYQVDKDISTLNKVKSQIWRAHNNGYEVLVSFDESYPYIGNSAGWTPPAGWTLPLDGNHKTHLRLLPGCHTALPTVQEYHHATSEFLRRFPGVHLYSAWNEPNRSGDNAEPTAPYKDSSGNVHFEGMVRAGKFWRNLNWQCQNTPNCMAVAAGEFLDGSFREGAPLVYLTYYLQGSGPRPPLWAWHSYYDLRERGAFGRLQSFLTGTTYRNAPAPRVWITEMGGEVRLPSDTTSRLHDATDDFQWGLDNMPSNSRVTRIYAYQILGDSRVGQWDSGLVDPYLADQAHNYQYPVRDMYCRFLKHTMATPPSTCTWVDQ